MAPKTTELTPRQQNVMLAYIVRGGTRAAAEALGDLSARSVKAHLDVCVRKLGAEDARDLLRAALDAEIIQMNVDGTDVRVYLDAA